MPETQPNDPEKSQKTRSFGSFLLFIFILIVALAVFGGKSLKPVSVFSQDEYWWNLYAGRIETQTIEGTEQGSTAVSGRYRHEDGELWEFKVRFAAAGLKEEQLRQIKAQAEAMETLPPALIEKAVKDGWYVPLEARALRGTTGTLTPLHGRLAGEEDGLEPAAQPLPTVDSRLYVGAIARSRDAWGGAIDPPFPLPKVSGQVWFEIDLEPRGGHDTPDLAGLLGLLETHGAKVTTNSFDLTQGGGSRWTDSNSTMMTFLIWAGPWILIVAVFMIFMRQMRSQGGAGGVMSFGRSRAQLFNKESNTNVTFDDVAGAEEAKAEVREIVEFLKNPGRFTRIGGRMPRGVLLVGPPGCGKTLIAKAIAGEAEVPFFSISGSDFVEMFVGVGASRVRDLFKQARESSPCIIFLDEIDAVGRRRGSGMGGGHDEREQTLNAILVEMDGFATDKAIIVLAATNRPDVLDPALLRPGRFDREVTIDFPDLAGRQEILGVHLKRIKHETDIDVGVLARSTPGYSGADLAAIVNEAAIMAVLDKREEVGLEDLEEARDKVRYGRQKKSRKIEELDRRITAYHEAGHAVLATLVKEIDNPHKVTIVPRGRALGSTMMIPEKETYHMQRQRLLGELVVLFGGRVSEQEFCGDISAGASDDIQRATQLARTMVTELGMSESIGPINYAERQGSDFLGTELMRSRTHSEETAREIDQEVHRILDEAYARAEGLIRGNREKIETITQALMRWETVTGGEIERILNGEPVENLRPEPPEPEPAALDAGESAVPPTTDAREDELPGDLPGTPGLSPV